MTAKRHRLHLQAEWPRVFPSLGGAIRHIIGRQPLWYGLEVEAEPGEWHWVVQPGDSRKHEDYIEWANDDLR